MRHHESALSWTAGDAHVRRFIRDQVGLSGSARANGERFNEALLPVEPLICRAITIDEAAYGTERPDVHVCVEQGYHRAWHVSCSIR